MAPPLVITDEQVATGVQIFEAACAEVAATGASAPPDEADTPEGS
jgi:acetylornithine/succinyldiaminopimelate/putrescine aminotransferase